MFFTNKGSCLGHRGVREEKVTSYGILVLLYSLPTCDFNSH